MKLEMGTMSEKDKNLLIIVGSVIVIILLVRFGIVGFNNSISEKTTELESINSKAQEMKDFMEQHANIDSEIAQARQERDNETFLKKKLKDVEIDRTFYEIVRASNATVDSMIFGKPNVVDVPKFKVVKNLLSYPIRDSLAGIDEAERVAYNNDIVSASDGNTEVSTIMSASDKVNAAAEEAGMEQAPAESGAPVEDTCKLPTYNVRLNVVGDARTVFDVCDRLNSRGESYVITRISMLVDEATNEHKGEIQFNAYYTH